MNRLSIAALPLLASSLLAQGTQEAAEPNDTIATATPLTVLPAGEQAYGDITAADEDWFRVSLPTDLDYKIWTSPGFAGQIEDTRVRILASDGVTQIVDVDDGSTATHGYYTSMQGTLAAGDYFVCVRGYSASTIGSYTLDVVLAPLGTYATVGGPLTAIAEGAEDNDPRNPGGAATISAINTTNAGNISTGGGGASYTSTTADYDFYEVNVTAPGTLVMETVGGAPATALNDSVIFLTDAAYSLISFDDDGGAGLLSLLSEPVTPGTYYVAVKGWGTGNYDLEIALTAGLPSGASTVTVHPGGCPGSAGTPLLTVRATTGGQAGRMPEAPVLGSALYLDGVNLPPATLVLRIIGTRALAQPLSVAPWGAAACLLEVDQIDAIPGLSDFGGVHFWGLASPANVAFLGLPVHQQLAVLDTANNAINLTTSNRVQSVFGVSH